MVETPGRDPGGSRFESGRSPHRMRGIWRSARSHTPRGAGSIPAPATTGRWRNWKRSSLARRRLRVRIPHGPRTIHADVAQLEEARRSDRRQCGFDSRRQYQLDEAQLEARRHRKPEVGSSNLSVQTNDPTPMRGGGTGTTPGSEPGGPGSSPGLAATTMPLQLSRSLTVESACCAGGGSFWITGVAGSSPVVLRDVAQWQSTSVLRRSGSQADLIAPVSCEGRAYFSGMKGRQGLPFESAPLVHSVP